MIKERRCSYEVARLLKEKGFDEDTVFVWYEHLPKANAVHREDVGKPKMDYFYLDETSEKNFKFHNFAPIPPYINGEVYSAPTHQMACDWLMEKDIYISPKYSWFRSRKGASHYEWKPVVLRLSTGNIIYPQLLDMCEYYKTYGEAVDFCIKYSLANLIK